MPEQDSFADELNRQLSYPTRTFVARKDGKVLHVMIVTARNSFEEAVLEKMTPEMVRRELSDQGYPDDIEITEGETTLYGDPHG